MLILEALRNIKASYEDAVVSAQFNGNVYANGNKAKEALIRSQRVINQIHEAVKSSFVALGVDEAKIFPPPGAMSPEIKIEGFLKGKYQDISLAPNPNLIESLLPADDENEKILSINVRSQLSSLNKNIDTLYERTFAEALNLHLRFNEQCLGEVYLIPTHEYDDVAMLSNQVQFKALSRLENYIEMFQAINGRRDVSGDEFKYERVCLLVVDFREDEPKIYESIDELKGDGLVGSASAVSLDGLIYSGFAKDLLMLHAERFGQILT